MSAVRATHIAFVVAVLLPASSAVGKDLKDLYFGESLYYAYQELYFEALERLDTEIAQHYGYSRPTLRSRCETRQPFGWRESTSRRTNPTLPCTPWRG
jgi:hypothetical protein